MAELTRRRLLVAPFGLAAAEFGRAHAMEAPAVGGGGEAAGQAYLDRDTEGLVETRMHGGAGRLRVKFFDFQKAAQPNLFITYVIPPGCSEGVHTHRLGDRELGSYDEFYYVLEGSGVMQVAGRAIPVAAGDHVFAPLGVAHGVANPTGPTDLKLLLTAVERS